MVDLTPDIAARQPCPITLEAAQEAGLDALLARIVACRVRDDADSVEAVVHPSLSAVAPPSLLRDAQSGARRLAMAIGNNETIGIVTDYDVDGITSHALLTEAFEQHFGVEPARLKHFIGHRIRDGYGLSDNLADVVLADGVPSVLITADCGSSDQPRIERLRAAGVDVIVTDHHGVPAAGPPADAYATINPTRDDCAYPDAAIAGCMVAWLLMSELRARLIADGRLSSKAPKLSSLLDFVGLGTVADAVTLASPINRAVVLTGLEIINRYRRPCWRAMRTLVGQSGGFSTDDLGFQLGPRINARGRMDDPHAALHFLRATTESLAGDHLAVLDANNLERKATEREMVTAARAAAGARLRSDSAVVVVYDPSFHPGVQGIVASRLVEAFGRPTVVMSPSRDDGFVTGSMRSIAAVHARDALQAVAEADPGLLVAFGGHAGAAGLTVPIDRLVAFEAQLASAVGAQIGMRRLGPVIMTDGELPPGAIHTDTCHRLASLEPFGRGFEAPVFTGEFLVRDARAVGNDRTHIKLKLADAHGTYDAIWFAARASAEAPMPVESATTLRCVYRLDINTFRGVSALQLIVRYGQSI